MVADQKMSEWLVLVAGPADGAWFVEVAEEVHAVHAEDRLDWWRGKSELRLRGLGRR
jgi:hypothetical protein